MSNSTNESKTWKNQNPKNYFFEIRIYEKRCKKVGNFQLFLKCIQLYKSIILYYNIKKIIIYKNKKKVQSVSSFN